MTKSIHTLIALLFVFSISNAQIPNFSFENWTSMGSYYNPDQWGTMNNTTASEGIYTATKASPGNPGSWYLKLTSRTVSSGVMNGIAVSGILDSITKLPVSGFAYSTRPASFTGKWQHMIYGSSQGSITVTLSRWDVSLNQRVTVATANQTLSGMAMSWANFSINFIYADGNDPDSCIIVLKASGANPTNQDYLWVDNLAFAGTVTGIENNNSVSKSVSVFPNPSTSEITVDMNLISSQKTYIEITDIDGKIVLSKNVGVVQGSAKEIVDVSKFAKGSYFVKVSVDSGSIVKRIILN